MIPALPHPLSALDSPLGNDREREQDAFIAELLERHRHGDPDAQAKLFDQTYTELKKIAQRCMRGERPEHTLQATALLNEVFIKIAEGRAAAWNDRQHFMRFVARAMRSILFDHHRKRTRIKNTPPGAHLQLDEAIAKYEQDFPGEKFSKLDQYLDRLGKVDRTALAVLELIYFACIPPEEVATTLGMPLERVHEEYQFACAWIRSTSKRDREGDES